MKTYTMALLAGLGPHGEVLGTGGDRRHDVIDVLATVGPDERDNLATVFEHLRAHRRIDLVVAVLGRVTPDTLRARGLVAKQGLVIAELIDRGIVNAIVSTGALMAHGLSEAVGMVHYRHDPRRAGDRDRACVREVVRLHHVPRDPPRGVFHVVAFDRGRRRSPRPGVGIDADVAPVMPGDRR